jgi:hypothetical protein
MYVPSGANFITRFGAAGPCPSAMKMLPSGATSTSFGRVSRAGGSPGSPGVPIVIRSSPLGLNFRTACPSPTSSAPEADASVIQISPFGSTNMPCGQAIIPDPKLRSTLPSVSSSNTGSTSEPTHVFCPHRSATHRLPSWEGYIALTAPQLRPSGRSPQV